MPNPQIDIPYHIGCPVWSCKEWIGTLLPKSTPANSLLKEYSQRLNAVEGNASFYALPAPATIERWMAESADGFRFSMKFPQIITHERRLQNCSEETHAFIKVLETLTHGDRCGPAFLQLPPSFNRNSFDLLKDYLKQLPKDFNFAVEPRHVSWFDDAEAETMLNDLLEEFGIDKVIFDSRPLFAETSPDESEQDAQSRKPNNPVHKKATANHPFLRLVGLNNPGKTLIWINEWAPVITKWILDGKKPYIFVHAPNERYAPEIAQLLHEKLRSLNPLLPALPTWPGDKGNNGEEPEQLSLF